MITQPASRGPHACRAMTGRITVVTSAAGANVAVLSALPPTLRLTSTHSAPHTTASPTNSSSWGSGPRAAPVAAGGLAAFAEEVRHLGPALDVGCGPGTVTAHLASLGLDVSGVDLSPRMVAHARYRDPELHFAVASATEVRIADASVGDPRLVVAVQPAAQRSCHCGRVVRPSPRSGWPGPHRR